MHVELNTNLEDFKEFRGFADLLKENRGNRRHFLDFQESFTEIFLVQEIFLRFNLYALN